MNEVMGFSDFALFSGATVLILAVQESEGDSPEVCKADHDVDERRDSALDRVDARTEGSLTRDSRTCCVCYRADM